MALIERGGSEGVAFLEDFHRTPTTLQKKGAKDGQYLEDGKRQELVVKLWKSVYLLNRLVQVCMTAPTLDTRRISRFT